MYEKLLVPIDEGKLSVEAIKEAVGLADEDDTTLYGLYVVRSPDAVGTSVEERSRLQSLAEQAEEHGLDFEIAVRKGTPEDEICDFAAENDIDAIVMATHARTGLSALFYGSVTKETIRKSPCPVLVLPNKQDN